MALIASAITLAGWPQSEVDQVGVEASVGLDGGRVVPNTHNPFHVTLANNLDDFDGALEITVIRGPQAQYFQPASVHLTHPLELPRGSRKEVKGILFCTEEDTELEIRLLDSRGRDFVPPFLLGFGHIDLGRSIVAAVSEQPREWQQLRSPPDTVAGLGRQVIALPPARFPAHWAALGPVTTVIWDGDRWPAHGPYEARALQTWVARGGTLAVGTGPAWPKILPSPLAEFLPFDFGETITVSAGQAGGRVPLTIDTPLVLTSVSPEQRPNRAEVLATLHGRPLLLTWPLGEGRVVLCTASLGALWAAVPSDRERLASLIVPPSEPWLAQAPLDPAVAAMTREIASVQRVRVPRANVIGRWLLAIWVVLVPGNFLVARLMGRRDFAWALVPALALASSGLIWHRALRGALPLESVHQLQVVTCPTGSPDAWLRGIVSIASRVEEVYDITFSDPGVALAPLFGTQGVIGMTEDYTLLPGVPSGIRGLHLDPRAQRWLAVDAAVPNPVKIQIEAGLSGDGKRVRLQWSDPLGTVAERWLALWRGRVHELAPESLRAAGSATIEGSEGTPLDSWEIASELQMSDPTGLIPDRLARLIASQPTDLGELCLLGVRGSALTGLRVHTANRPSFPRGEQSQGTAALLVPIPLTSETDEATWHQWAWRAEIPGLGGYSVGNGETTVVPINGNEDMFLTFHPRGRGFRDWESGALELEFEGQLGGSQAFGYPGPSAFSVDAARGSLRTHVAIFEWARQRWVERAVASVQGVLRWDESEAYLHPLTGQVVAAVWVTSDARSPVDLGLSPVRPPRRERDAWRRGPTRDRSRAVLGFNWRLTRADLHLHWQTASDDRPQRGEP